MGTMYAHFMVFYQEHSIYLVSGKGHEAQSEPWRETEDDLAQFRFKSCHLEVFTNFLNLGVSVYKSGIIWSMSLGSPDD